MRFHFVGSGNQRPRIGRQTWSPRLLGQAKDAREKLVFGFQSADINDGRCRQLLLEDVEELYPRFLAERSNRFIYNDQRGLWSSTRAKARLCWSRPLNSLSHRASRSSQHER